MLVSELTQMHFVKFSHLGSTHSYAKGHDPNCSFAIFNKNNINNNNNNNNTNNNNNNNNSNNDKINDHKI